MEISYQIFFLLITLAMFCEFIDSSLGMGYGTILSPLLILIGFDPLLAIPAVLLSQAFGGLSATYFHHKYKNINLSKNSKDIKIAFVISLTGALAAITGALTAISVSKYALNLYISILILTIGIFLISNLKFTFSWKKIYVLGFISAFNKGLSGGGFGPIVTGGQIISGNNSRSSIGVTTLSEVPICLISFFVFIVGKASLVFSELANKSSFMELYEFFDINIINFKLILTLSLGATIAAPFGAICTSYFKNKETNKYLGILILFIGLLSLMRFFL